MYNQNKLQSMGNPYKLISYCRASDLTERYTSQQHRNETKFVMGRQMSYLSSCSMCLETSVASWDDIVNLKLFLMPWWRNCGTPTALYSRWQWEVWGVWSVEHLRRWNWLSSAAPRWKDAGKRLCMTEKRLSRFRKINTVFLLKSGLWNQCRYRGKMHTQKMDSWPNICSGIVSKKH